MKRGAPNLILSGRVEVDVSGVVHPSFGISLPSAPPFSPLVPRSSIAFRILGSDGYSGHHQLSLERL
jgi:hypothetical protein